MTDVDPHLRDTLKRELDDVKRRLRVLESTNRLTSASIKEGSLEVRDEDDLRRVTLGDLDDDGAHYGVRVLDANGATRLQLDERGIVAPLLLGQVVSVNDGVTAGGSLVVTHKVYLSEIAHEGLEIRVPFDATGVVGVEAQVFDATGGILATGIGTASAALGVIRFQWLHGIPLGTSPQELWVYARKSSGAGTLTIRPAIVWGRSPAGCTANGL